MKRKNCHSCIHHIEGWCTFLQLHHGAWKGHDCQLHQAKTDNGEEAVSKIIGILIACAVVWLVWRILG